MKELNILETQQISGGFVGALVGHLIIHGAIKGGVKLIQNNIQLKKDLLAHQIALGKYHDAFGSLPK